MSRDTVFLKHLRLIDEVVDRLCFSRHLDAADADDFRSQVYLRLLERDAAVLRGHSGRGSLRGYLRVVVGNLYRDYQDHQLGKWRPSAAAKRLGQQAVALDRLMNRDGMPVSVAVATLCGGSRNHHERRALFALAARVPHRPHRRSQGLDQIPALRDDRPTPEESLLSNESGRRLRRLVGQLMEAIDELPVEDREIVRLKFWEGLTVSEIARRLELPQKPLYRRLSACIGRLGACMNQPKAGRHGTRIAFRARTRTGGGRGATREGSEALVAR